MDFRPHPMALRTGIVAAAAIIVLEIAYAAALAAGLASLDGPDQPIGDPYFTAMEVLILLLAPALVLFTAAIHACAPPGRKTFSLAALVFMGILASLTAAVHFSILTLSRHPSFADMGWLLSFTWPSVVYALDILAWDVFFPLAVICAAATFPGPRLAALCRWLLIASGVVALLGLAGVVAADMQLRNIGIIGYTLVFPIAAAAVLLRFRQMASVAIDP